MSSIPSLASEAASRTNDRGMLKAKNKQLADEIRKKKRLRTDANSGLTVAEKRDIAASERGLMNQSVENVKLLRATDASRPTPEQIAANGRRLVELAGEYNAGPVDRVNPADFRRPTMAQRTSQNVAAASGLAAPVQRAAMARRLGFDMNDPGGVFDFGEAIRLSNDLPTPELQAEQRAMDLRRRRLLDSARQESVERNVPITTTEAYRQLEEISVRPDVRAAMSPLPDQQQAADRIRVQPPPPTGSILRADGTEQTRLAMVLQQARYQAESMGVPVDQTPAFASFAAQRRAFENQQLAAGMTTASAVSAAMDAQTAAPAPAGTGGAPAAANPLSSPTLPVAASGAGTQQQATPPAAGQAQTASELDRLRKKKLDALGSRDRATRLNLAASRLDGIEEAPADTRLSDAAAATDRMLPGATTIDNIDSMSDDQLRGMMLAIGAAEPGAISIMPRGAMLARLRAEQTKIRMQTEAVVDETRAMAGEIDILDTDQVVERGSEANRVLRPLISQNFQTGTPTLRDPYDPETRRAAMDVAMVIDSTMESIRRLRDSDRRIAAAQALRGLPDSITMVERLEKAREAMEKDIAKYMRSLNNIGVSGGGPTSGASLSSKGSDKMRRAAREKLQRQRDRWNETIAEMERQVKMVRELERYANRVPVAGSLAIAGAE